MLSPVRRRLLVSLCFVAVTSLGVVAGAERRTVLVIGDSLSREYQFEFPAFSEARNWVEILAEHRPDDLFFGALEELDLELVKNYCRFFNGTLCEALNDGEEDLMRYRYNWAIPTFTAEAYRDNLTGSGASDLIWQGFIEEDFDDVDTVVVFLGGNDFDSVYGSIYGGNTATANAMIDSLTDDLEAIVDYVQGQNSDLEIVLCNVPHVGATPEVKGDHPTDPVKTGRVTDALSAINDELAQFAADEGIAFADVAQLTLDLLEPDSYCIGGIEFFNAGSNSGAVEYIWLGGSISQNFHPNTSGQSEVANAIIAALNETYGAGVAPLSNREILETILGLDADKPFADWASAYGLGEGEDGPGDDPERDGLVSLIEFALDLSPLESDAGSLPSPVLDGADLQLTYSPRDADCLYVRIVPEASSDLAGWVAVAAEDIADNGDGSLTASTTETYLRLRVELVE